MFNYQTVTAAAWLQAYSVNVWSQQRLLQESNLTVRQPRRCPSRYAWCIYPLDHTCSLYPVAFLLGLLPATGRSAYYQQLNSSLILIRTQVIGGVTSGLLFFSSVINCDDSQRTLILPGVIMCLKRSYIKVPLECYAIQRNNLKDIWYRLFKHSGLLIGRLVMDSR